MISHTRCAHSRCASVLLGLQCACQGCVCILLRLSLSLLRVWRSCAITATVETQAAADCGHFAAVAENRQDVSRTAVFLVFDESHSGCFFPSWTAIPHEVAHSERVASRTPASRLWRGLDRDQVVNCRNTLLKVNSASPEQRRGSGRSGAAQHAHDALCVTRPRQRTLRWLRGRLVGRDSTDRRHTASGGGMPLSGQPPRSC